MNTVLVYVLLLLLLLLDWAGIGMQMGKTKPDNKNYKLDSDAAPNL